MKIKSKILIIAGSDSSGGAGIQADIKTVTALGGYAMTAVTAVTIQNTKKVSAVVPIKPKEIAKQILFTCKDIKPNTILPKLIERLSREKKYTSRKHVNNIIFTTKVTPSM